MLPAASGSPASGSGIQFNFKTLDDPYDPDFNRLLDINNDGRIVGYSGAHTTVYESYLIYPPYAGKNYRTIAYPSAAWTIAACLNDRRTVCGYCAPDKSGSIYGYVDARGIWVSYEDPHAKGSDGVTEILGLSDDSLAVGTYQTPSSNGAFELTIGNGKFQDIGPKTGSNTVATAINGHGDIVGYTTISGQTVGFLYKSSAGKYKEFSYPGAASTEFLGITVDDRIVGFYTTKSGDKHGFILTHPLFGLAWEQIDDPDAAGTTVVTAINMHNAIVGYYVDGSGTNHGFLGTPATAR